MNGILCFVYFTLSSRSLLPLGEVGVTHSFSGLDRGE